MVGKNHFESRKYGIKYSALRCPTVEGKEKATSLCARTPSPNLFAEVCLCSAPLQKSRKASQSYPLFLLHRLVGRGDKYTGHCSSERGGLEHFIFTSQPDGLRFIAIVSGAGSCVGHITTLRPSSSLFTQPGSAKHALLGGCGANGVLMEETARPSGQLCLVNWKTAKNVYILRTTSIMGTSKGSCWVVKSWRDLIQSFTTIRNTSNIIQPMSPRWTHINVSLLYHHLIISA